MKKLKARLKAAVSSYIRGDLLRDLNGFGGDFHLDAVIPTFRERAYSQNELAFTAHVYYADYLRVLLPFLKNAPDSVKVYLTTSCPDIASYLEIWLRANNVKGRVVAAPNVGRNFGPLLVEFADEIKRHRYFIHAHSKKSPHSPKALVKEWHYQTDALVLNWDSISSSIDLMNERGVGVVHPMMLSSVRNINLRWGPNLEALKRVPLPNQLTAFLERQGYICFPVGGMFIADTQALQPLFEVKWSYEMFGKEEGLLDFSLAHAVERLFGVVPEYTGRRQALFDGRQKIFFIKPL